MVDLCIPIPPRPDATQRPEALLSIPAGNAVDRAATAETYPYLNNNNNVWLVDGGCTLSVTS